MAFIRAPRLASRLTVVLAVAALAPLVTSCQLLGIGQDEPLSDVGEVEDIKHGACIPTYGNQVSAADMNAAGSRVIYLTSNKPGTLPEDRSWSSDDQALVVMDIQADGSARSRHIATSWAAQEIIPAYATEPPTPRSVRPIELTERMRGVQLDDAGASFVVGVSRRGGTGLYSGLYSGAVPASGTAELSPGDGAGLSPIQIASPSGIEAITDFWLSPDGGKVAAIVGNQSELRVYDLQADSNNLFVYELDDEGKVQVGHEMPAAGTSVETARRPAITSRGLLRAVWSPASDRLAIVRTAGDAEVGSSALQILDVATGAMETVKTFSDSASPHAAWSDDGSSLWVLNTPFGSSGDSEFGNARIRHLEAKENGKDLTGSEIILPRELGWRTDPAFLVNFKDGESLLYIQDSNLFRFDIQDASTGYILQDTFYDVPAKIKVLPVSPVASSESDRVMFLLQEASGTKIAIRNHASAETCPLSASPEGDAAPAEGDAAPAEGDAAPAEGDAASDDG